MNIATNPLFEELAECKNILLAGAGGGFDIYSAIPLYFALRDLNKKVHLANLSFASLSDPDARISDHCYKVSKETKGSSTYFPEKTLCEWLDERQNISEVVYAFPQTGVVPLQKSYEKLTANLDLDAIVLVDGGTDSLLRGDEVGLGTPAEDAASLVAVSQTSVEKKILTCIGFGVDRFHGVCHAQYLESVAALTKRGEFLGSFSLLPQTAEARKYLDLVRYSSERTSRPSIVNTSIASAVAGEFGDHHATSRTSGSQLWISPLMSMYWSFQLQAVVDRNLYAERLVNTQDLFDVSTAIQEFRKDTTARKWDVIPD